MNNDETRFLRPPEGVPTLCAGDLEYWLVEHAPNPGRQISVQTSDPTISLHGYGGGRDEGLSHLFCYKGFRIGFLLDRPDDAVLPRPAGPALQDEKRGVFVREVTHLGSPVVDLTRTWQRDQMGIPIRDKNGRPLRDTAKAHSGAKFITGLSWEDYNQGMRDKFESVEQQDAVVALLPELLVGLLGGLQALRPDGPRGLLPSARFSKNLINSITRGDFIQ